MEETLQSEYTEKYPPILPGTKEWPVVQLSKNRKDFIDKVINDSIEQVKLKCPTRESLIEEIEKTRYREKMRMRRNPWKVDPEDEVAYWGSVKKRLIKMQEGGTDEADTILREVVSRYAHEIAGNFKQSRYRMARGIVKFGFRRLLNAAQLGTVSSLWKGNLTLRDKIHLTGEIQQLRKLAKTGTIVMVPTHFSNLDSITIGWAIHEMGLPPFIYGAGLNLFNIGIFAYFMNSLGAYKVDRRKKNLLYLETLKSYSKLAIGHGCHSLFFPGGTRSRSGAIESRLKLGLLGTAMEAQRMAYAKDSSESANKIFIVPVVLNYNFVLEAPSLIDQYLKSTGQERYYKEMDQFSSSYKITKFLLKFFTKGTNISLSIGRAMDLLGNFVDTDGNSLDKYGNQIEERDYFKSNGIIVEDAQRESEYTVMLSKRIVEEFHRINRVFSSHLVAFTAFELYRKQHGELDFYNFLRFPEEDLILPYEKFRKKFKKLRKKILKLKENGKVDVADHMLGKLDDAIELGIRNVGMYHNRRPLLRNKDGDIITQDLTVLYFYRNRLDGYGLEKFI